MTWHIQHARPEHAGQMEDLQRRVFPTLSAAEILTREHYLAHLRIFPEGQFVALDGGRVVGATTTMRYHLDLRPHTFLEVSGNLWMTTHEPSGDWLYGLDLGVDPAWRRQGMARAFYRARQEQARALGLKGQITVGMMNGYGAVSHLMSPEDYFEGLRRGEIQDPTVSMQLSVGFVIRALIKGYLSDPACGDCGVLMTLED